jgi:hypothetical protein
LGSATPTPNSCLPTPAPKAQINRLELQITELRNKRDQRLIGIWENVKRARYTVKGTYGDDSSEYELMGGKRMSERKRSLRKQAASVAQPES